MKTVEIVFLLLLLFVAAFGALACRLRTPYPIILVIAGLLLGFIPGIPRITLNPDIVFFAALPPLLYSAAWRVPWREFSYNLVSIFSLAFGLVTFTVLVVAEVAQWFLPGFDWRMGFTLGAIVAPTDAIAATSIARRIGLPQRIVDVLEGESLINDASALLAFEFGIAMLVRGQSPTVVSGLLRLAYLAVGGVAVGLLIGVTVNWFEHRIDDGPIEIALSLLTPYATYLAADSLRSSGVLAVVACGLYLSRRSSDFFSPAVRLQTYAVWDSLTFILNGLVFILIGLQLPYVLAEARDHSLRALLMYGALFSAILILLRLVWMFPGARISNFIRRRALHQREPAPPARQVFFVGWTGMRGVISLAAAISLPQTLANGVPFTQRQLIIFLTFSVILVTLVLQGLTLAPLARALGLVGVANLNVEEEEEARRLILETALRHLDKVREDDKADFTKVFDDLELHYRDRLATLTEEETDIHSARYGRYIELSRELLQVERRTAIRLRNERRINDELLRQLEREMDLAEARLLAGNA
ncbi:MAG: Na+/H+ antiporter [Blastocatellia bacterium]|nr:Na+/H+ antiporter [Blastocatellia bacterium]